MAKWAIIVPTVFDELFYTGGLLSSISIKQAHLGIELSTEEKPYIIFCVVSDTNNKKTGHISTSQYYREVYESSRLLGFNYKVLFVGRDYLNKLYNYPYELEVAIRKEINFVKPEYIICPQPHHGSLDDFVITGYSVMAACNNYYGNILTYDRDLSKGNFFITVERGLRENNPVDNLSSVYSVYKSRINSNFSKTDWEYKYYNMSNTGTHINKEFAESFSIQRMVSNNILDFTGLQLKEKVINKDELRLEDIL